MARDYKKELEKEQESKKQITVKMKKELFNDFIAKVELENKTNVEKIRELVESYTYSEKE